MLIDDFCFSVPPEWCDYNQHFSDGYYLVAFSNAMEVVLRSAGLGEQYKRQAPEFSTYTVDARVRYHAEGKAGDCLRISNRLAEVHAKRILVVQQMWRAEQLLASAETVCVHVDTRLPKSVPFPPAIYQRLMQLLTA